MTDRELDLVLYGATGFIGNQCARYLKDYAAPSTRWAIAGRDRRKLEDLAGALGLTDQVSVIVADGQSPPAIEEMVRSTRTVVAVASPYGRIGEPVVAACVQHRTDYLDLTGETPWVRDMIDRYHDRAQSDGTRIVPCCGFDAVPSDIGTLVLVDALRRQGRTCRAVKAFFVVSGGINGGTAASILNVYESGEVQRLNDPFLLNPQGTRPPAGTSQDPVAAHYDSDLGAWVAPFVMAPVNTRVVRRSAALMEQWREPYGTDFTYQEYLDTGSPFSWVSATMAASGLAAGRASLLFPGGRQLAEIFSPKPGTGPSEREMDDGHFRCRLVASAHDGSLAWARLADRGDPANRVTVKILCEAALALATQRSELPGGEARGGILTPATALGSVLMDRLRSAGMTLEVES